jgi:hypothetical protein
MNISLKASALSLGMVFAAGLIIGFVPAHLNNNSLSNQKEAFKSALMTSQNALKLSSLTVRAAGVYSEAEKNNFSVASTEASGFFTDLRIYINGSSDTPLKQQLEEVMSSRDSTIAALAKVDPAVISELHKTFETMNQIQTANQVSK